MVARLLPAMVAAAWSENITRQEVSAKEKWKVTRDGAMRENRQLGRLGYS
jgi:hypothetical protein